MAKIWPELCFVISEPLVLATMVSFIHQIFIEGLLCIRHQAKCFRAYKNEWVIIIAMPISNAMGILPHQIDNWWNECLPQCLANFKHWIYQCYIDCIMKNRTPLSTFQMYTYLSSATFYLFSHTLASGNSDILAFLPIQSFRPHIGAFCHIFSHWLLFLQDFFAFQTCFSKVILIFWRVCFFFGGEYSFIKI